MDVIAIGVSWAEFFFKNCDAEFWIASFRRTNYFLESVDQVGGRQLAPGGLEPRTLRLLAVRSDQLGYETS